MSSSTKYPQTGSGSWTNPGYITTDDSNYASTTVAKSNVSIGIYASNFGFQIPPGSTILGFVAVANAKASYSSQTFSNGGGAYLGTYSSGTWTATSSIRTNASSISTSTFTDYSFGGTTDLWNTTITPADINASTFAVRFLIYNGSSQTRTEYIDYVTLTVYYLETNISTKNGLAYASINKANGLVLSGSQRQIKNIDGL